VASELRVWLSTGFSLGVITAGKPSAGHKMRARTALGIGSFLILNDVGTGGVSYSGVSLERIITSPPQGELPPDRLPEVFSNSWSEVYPVLILSVLNELYITFDLIQKIADPFGNQYLHEVAVYKICLLESLGFSDLCRAARSWFL
jgi:hypothetical protein